MKIVFDTNCFIDAFSPAPCLRNAIQALMNAHKEGAFELHVSRHTLAELHVKHDAAFGLAKTFPVLPHWPIGTWSDQAASWEQMAGTWCDIKRNDSKREELSKLAKCRDDIRDHGALLDALHAKADAFVTSDKHLVGSGPAKRILENFGLRVISPAAFWDIIKDIHSKKG